MNTVKTTTESGKEIEVYTSAIESAFDEYVSQLEDPELIRKSATFAGAMRHIYERVFQPHEPQIYNRKSVIDTADIGLLDAIWGRYARLCYLYGQRPTLLRFSLMCGVTMETFGSWKDNQWRSKSDSHSSTVKRWLSECESSIYDGVLDNQVGAIFAAKANFGWRETAPVELPQTASQVLDTPEQIAERHRNARLPEKPVFDFDED